ncbi:phosphate/phosphite/phosphonate ABC transporter substrate-binding protein [Paenibacillus sp. GSMTC-2017]|uniref:substrate-binding domain-containing protein n=1 Tax=Paenibacillus sp. GSMTC-2017 TaxID=2794350 RepID=UPI0018D8D2CC|nr:phosphate/phosphite/phosphonate ABC transporter substrate-binding protein [Paenibacillus sp. GSMTC-2017]MBH5318843.1 phosphate/phosphite/phosphonate ABC transporter substrate-binding protein [Paenibacillus sp. GSMTC-2017]
MNKMYKLLLIVLISLLVLGCQGGHTSYDINFSKIESAPLIESPDNEPDPVRVAFSSVLNPADTIKYYKEISNYIGSKLNRPVILIQRKSYSEISMLMINGGADIALLSAGAFITYRNVAGLEAIAMQERMGLPYYQGYLVVNKESNITDIHELRGKSIAFTDPISYSGYIFIDQKLDHIGEDPEQFFGRHVYTYNHENSLLALLDKVVDAAAVNNLVLKNLELSNPEVAETLQIIEESATLGTGPVVVNNQMPSEDKNRVKEIFLSMHEDPKMLKALEGLSIDRYVPVDFKLFEAIENTIPDRRGR